VLQASFMVLESAELRRFLLDVADERVATAMIAPPTFEWAYAPYDGGADVFANTQARDELRDRHLDSLSSLPSGL
jgi:hypothetical protein